FLNRPGIIDVKIASLLHLYSIEKNPKVPIAQAVAQEQETAQFELLLQNGRHKRGDVRACQIFKIMVFGDDITIKWLLETGGGPINCAVHFQYYGVDKISLLVELDAVV